MDKNDNQAVIDLAAGLLAQHAVDSNAKPFKLLPPGYQIHDLESTLVRPMRKRGTAKFNDSASFIDYFKLHAADSRIYGQVDPPLFIAVLNDDSEDAAGWGDHRAQYQCPLSKEWKAWKGFAGTPRDQISFAEFIETNTPDIVSTAQASRRARKCSKWPPASRHRRR
jgi:uncharacterized protein YfdQ (DUF2303 family)